jgi:cbb3-type cytochrome oxidase subunit 3
MTVKGLSKKMWFLIILIIILIVIIIFVYRNSDTSKRDNKIKTSYADIKDNLQTGDILLFRYSNHANKAAQMIYFCRTRLVGSDYGHVAMVLREKGKLYAIEGVDIGHTAEDEGVYFNSQGKGGVRIIKLETLLERYHHDYGGLFAVRHTKRRISNKILMQTVLNYREQVFEDRKYLGSLLIMDYFSHGL